MRSIKFIISGGGTGGHIYPALAIASGIKDNYKNSEILFVKVKFVSTKLSLFITVLSEISSELTLVIKNG